MANSEEIKVIITAEDKASGVLSTFGNKVQGLSGTLKAGLGVALTGVTAAIGSLTAVGISSVKAFDEQQKAAKQMEAVLKSTGNAAGLFQEDLEEQASALQRLTTYGDEAVMSAQNLLLTFTNVKGPIFQDAIGTILDMSTALGQDLKSSAIQVGKALQDPILGVSALRRVGVNFSETQQEMIKGMVESGRVMEAQKFILKELATEFGGSAQAAAETFGGRMTQLKNAVGDLQEQIGGAIITAITPFVTQLVEFAQRPETQQQIQGIADKIANMATQLAPLAQKLLPAMIQGLQIAVGVVTWLGKAFIETTDFLGNFIFKIMQLVEWVQKMIDKINEAISAMGRFAQKNLDVSGGLGFTNKIGDSISEFFGFRASGGPVSKNQPYIVGEQGPELFIPGSSGQILASGRGLGSVVVNITGTFLSENVAADLGDMLVGRLKQELRI